MRRNDRDTQRRLGVNRPEDLTPPFPACLPADPHPLLAACLTRSSWHLRQARGRHVWLPALTPSHRANSLLFLPTVHPTSPSPNSCTLCCLPACCPAAIPGCMPNPLLWRHFRQARGRHVWLSDLTPSLRPTTLL